MSQLNFVEIPATLNSIANRKPIQGVGINDANYRVSHKNKEGKQVRCPYYRVWAHMIERGYSNIVKKNHPTYRDCTVCDEWLLFSNFRAWMKDQNWEGKELDKDIIKPNNKLYSPETCCFVDHVANSIILGCAARRGALKQGVTFDKFNNKYKSQCGIPRKGAKNLGRFKTEQEAFDVYCEFKSALIFEIAHEQEDLRIKDGLIRHANLYKNGEID